MDFGSLAAIVRPRPIVNMDKLQMLDESRHRPYAAERDAFNWLVVSLLERARQ